MLYLTEMSVECENNLISHEWYFRESELEEVERVKDKKSVYFWARKGLGEGKGQYKR